MELGKIAIGLLIVALVATAGYFLITWKHNFSITIVGSACWAGNIGANTGELSLIGMHGCGNRSWELDGRQSVDAGFTITNGTGLVTLSILKDGAYCSGDSSPAIVNRTVSASCDIHL